MTVSRAQAQFLARRSLANSLPMPLSKIVATIGPTSEHQPVLSQVVEAGMRIMRINFSHATYEEADLRIKNLGTSPGLNHSTADGLMNVRAVMLGKWRC
jgi:pyruvate kinase